MIMPEIGYIVVWDANRQLHYNFLNKAKLLLLSTTLYIRIECKKCDFDDSSVLL